MGGLDEPQPALGRAVRTVREERGETQESLAQKAGVTTGTISLIERGRSNPAWGTIKAIARALDIPIGDLGHLSEESEK